jgi:hypothetical protein
MSFWVSIYSVDRRFADLLGHRLAAARAQSFRRVKASSAKRQYRQTRRILPCCMEMVGKKKEKKNLDLGRTWGQGLVCQHILHGKW